MCNVMEDALGRALHVGDQVACVHRCGSNVAISQREVTAMDHESMFITLEGGLGKVMPYEVINLSYTGVDTWPRWMKNNMEKEVQQ